MYSAGRKTARVELIDVGHREVRGVVAGREALRLAHETRETRPDLVPDAGHHVVPVEDDVGGPGAARLDHEGLDPPGPDPLVRRAEPPPRRASDARAPPPRGGGR